VKLKLKIKPKPPQRAESYESKDTKSLTKLRIRFKKKSERIRKEEIKEENKETSLALQSSRAELYAPGTALNASGNLRGMHSAMNPPSSEEMRKKRAMRRFHNKQLPVSQCNGCSFASQCPNFKAGYECSFTPFLNSHRIEGIEDVQFYMKEMIAANIKRMQQAVIFETLSGGAPSIELSEALNMAVQQLKVLNDTLAENDSVLEIETDDTSIIGKLFGDLSGLIGDTRSARENPIEIEALVVSETEKLELEEDAADNLASEAMNDFQLAQLGSKSRSEKIDRHKGIDVSEVGI